MSTTVDIMEESSKAPLIALSKQENIGEKRVMAIMDFILRIVVMFTALAAAAAMGTSDETLPFFTQFFQSEAIYDDLFAFRFFVIAMAIVGGYIVLSLPFSVVTIIRPNAVGPRLVIFLDILAAGLASSSATTAAVVVFLAPNGNSYTNWLAICNQFGDFCEKVSGAVVASFITVVLLTLQIVLSAFSSRRQ